MKKILSMILVLCILCTLLLAGTTASVSAGTISSDVQDKLPSGTLKYFCIRQDVTVKIYEFTYWVKVTNQLPDIKDYTAQRGEEIERMYLDYVAEKMAEIRDENVEFFEENFDASKDELIHASDNRGFLLVKSDAFTISKLATVEGCSVIRGHAELSSAESFYNINNSNYYFPEEPYMDDYELVYATHFYKDAPEPRYADQVDWDFGGYMYHHMYDHYAEGTGTEDEATPDYVLVFAGQNICSPAYSAGGFGDKYLLQEYNIYYPYTLGYHIITTEDMKVLTLREAWDAQLVGIEDVFEDFGLGQLRGDSNLDREINVKDATYIQKCLAGLEEFTEDEYVSGFSEPGQGNVEGGFSDRVSDMNMDGQVNVRDATAIQKYIAGIVEE